MLGRTVRVGALVTVMGSLVVGCFDDTPRDRPDGGTATPGVDGGAPGTAVSPLVPAGAIVGSTKTIAGSPVTTWAKVDSATQKVTEIGWELPLAVIATIGSTVDFREGVEFPPIVLEQTGMYGTTIDYLPRGHAPPGVYDTPHWEFHSYYLPQQDFYAINCTDQTPVPEATLPDDFAIVPPPDNCTPGMGVHGIGVKSPEFNQERFTKSHTLSFYGGSITALEPKMTKEILQQRKSFDFDVPRMKKVLLGKLYPAKFEARYDAANDAYLIVYSGFSPMVDTQ